MNGTGSEAKTTYTSRMPVAQEMAEWTRVIQPNNNRQRAVVRDAWRTPVRARVTFFFQNRKHDVELLKAYCITFA